MALKKLILVLVLGFSVTAGLSQQDPQFSQYMFNEVSFNPGFAGSGGGICINGLVRQQWAGFKDPEGNKVAPETFLLSVDSPVKILHGAISGLIMQDKIGFWRDIDLKLGYTYMANIGRGNFGAGFHIAFVNRSVDFSKFIFIQESDPIKTKLSSEETDMLFDFSLGLFYEIPDQFYIGLSAVDLLQSDGKPLISTDSGNDFKYTLDRSVYITAGYTFTLPNYPSFEIMPSALVKIGQASNQFDISAIVEYKDKFWAGMSYRYQDAIVAILGLEFKNFKIGYSYDIATTGYGLGGSHEIMLGYCFKLELDKARKSYYNTRFL